MTMMTAHTASDSFFTRLGDVFMQWSHNLTETAPAYRGARYASALYDQTDEQLAARGLKRGDILYHAMGPLAYH